MALLDVADELDLERPEACPNCGSLIGGASECHNCGAILSHQDELGGFESDDDLSDDF